MSFNLFSHLNWRIPKKLSVMPEKVLCENNVTLLNTSGLLAKYQDITGPFDLIKKAVVINALINKKQIEDESELYQDLSIDGLESYNIIHSKLPYFEIENTKIYVPIFSIEDNVCYDTLTHSLIEPEYIKYRHSFAEKIIDPFETYGLDLFKSPFTRLILLMEDQSCGCFFHPELNEVFIINRQGMLDQTIPLFDSFIKERSYEDFFPRLKLVFEKFFAFDKEGFINALHTEGFISDNLFDEIGKRYEKEKIKKDNKIRKKK